MHIVIITGLSGSGKSLALHTLEDQGYYCIDNLPIELLEQVLKTPTLKKQPQIAICIDVRGGEKNIKNTPQIINRLKKQIALMEVIYFYADQQVLLKRFNETRRRHPLSIKKGRLTNAIQHEKALLKELALQADFRLDTSRTDIYELAFLLKRRVCACTTSKLSLMFQSFGFKHEAPSNSDFVFDVRCLPNPYWLPELRMLTGKDKAIQNWLQSHENVIQMRDDIIHYLEKWIPSFVANQKAYLTVSIGCTGGRHRSVFIAEQLTQYFQKKYHQQKPTYDVISHHRELPLNL